MIGLIISFGDRSILRRFYNVRVRSCRTQGQRLGKEVYNGSIQN